MDMEPRWYDHVKHRDDDCVGRKVLEVQLPGKGRWGRPKMKCLDVMKEDMQR